MEKKMSVNSDKSTKRHVRSKSFLDSLLSSGNSDKPRPKEKKDRVLNNSQELGISFDKKTVDAIKITPNNFRQVVIGLAHRILTGNPGGKDLLQDVARYVKNQDKEFDQQIQKMLVDINYVKDTFDLLSPLKVIEARIIKETLRKDNPVGRLAFDVWYDYLHDKYNVDKMENFKLNWVRDVNHFKEFFANVVYQVYGEWVFLIEKRKDMFPYFCKEFTPYLLTSHPKFDIVYKIVLRHLGQEPLTINLNRTPQSFGIQPEFSCQTLKQPFQKTIDVIKSIYRDCGLKKKVIKIKELAVTLKQQLRAYQDLRISQGLQKEYKDIDSDNMVGCFAYCIVQARYGGVFEALDFLELFFLENEKEKSSDYIQGLKIGHIMASLQTAALYLRQQGKKQQA